MTEHIENSINELISVAAERGGHVYIVDKKRNRFALRLQEPVKVLAYIPKDRNEDTKNEKSNNQI